MIFTWTPLLNFLDRRTPYLFHFLMDEEVSEATQFGVKTYHGCWKVNKNSRCKLIDYKREERCLFPTNNHCWRRTKAKYLLDRPY